MIYREHESLEERCGYNASDLPSYDAAPYGEITEITEIMVTTAIMVITAATLIRNDIHLQL